MGQDNAPAVLTESEDGLVLTDGVMTLRADWRAMLPRLRQDRLNKELLVRAARRRGAPEGALAVDATAGLGEDTVLLAAAGFRVIACERDPVIAALLRDALRKAGSDPELQTIAERIDVREEDSLTVLARLEERPELVYLDPMFPERRKSGLIKKKFQLLQQLEAPCDEEETLLAAAMDAGPRRIVVKRPRKAPPLGGRAPSHTLEGSTIRYDCYALPE